jgi:hypothetical protein
MNLAQDDGNCRFLQIGSVFRWFYIRAYNCAFRDPMKLATACDTSATLVVSVYIHILSL